MSERYFHSARAFARYLNDYADMTKRREAQLFTRVVNHCERSIRFGSPVTGAPGQPFRTGNLRDVSFVRKGSVADRDVSMAFTAPYAPIFEDQVGHATIVSEVGGFHSIKITQLNFRHILSFELAIVRAQIAAP